MIVRSVILPAAAASTTSLLLVNNKTGGMLLSTVPAIVWRWCGYYLVTVNVVEVGLFAWDKQMAKRNYWRISEHSLLSLALAGGTPGALWASQTFRHKTLKVPFRNRLKGIGILQALVLLYVLLKHIL